MSSAVVEPDTDRLLFDEFVDYLSTSHTAIWVPDEHEGWLKANVTRHDLIRTKRDEYLKLVVSIDHTNETRTLVYRPYGSDATPCARNTTLSDDVDDLVQLSHLNEPSVLHAIHSRYKDDTIYTYSGLVLASVNPYCDISGLYASARIEAYAGREREEREPHLFAVAEEAYRSMLRDGRSQSIIISGESGAGKTVSARLVMRYFAVADRLHSHHGDPRGESVTLGEQRVLSTNPILEAFGNAKTTRNDNSSRFGKYIQLCFVKDEIVGASIRTYLLEKTRVVFQSAHERNYHIFYQLLAAANDPELALVLPVEHLVGREQTFNYVNSVVIDGVDDRAAFKETVAAMRLTGFSDEDLRAIFSVLAGILHLGNVQIDTSIDDTSTIAEGDPHLVAACSLLGLDQQAVVHRLTHRLLVTTRDAVEVKLDAGKARNARDAVAKFLYTSLFNYIVDRLNALLSPPSTGSGKDELCFIGVLDIYGFERFPVNSFEQFCINYANERLQHEFTQHVFRAEQELYKAEDIRWSFIRFRDNQPCIELIESRTGIINLLDEECRFPNGTDASFLSKLLDQQAASTYLLPSRFDDRTFTVRHFAYDVAYTIDGFLEKNRDAIAAEFIGILRAGECRLVAESLVGGAIEGMGSTLSSPVRARSQEDFASSRRRSRQGSDKTKMGIATAFKHSLSALMAIISATDCHYIRCIKPNEEKQPDKFDGPFVLQQLRACGIIETIRISAAGYPARWTFSDFFSRYRLLGSGASEAPHGDERTACRAILAALGLTEEQFQIGLTRVFLRVGILAKLESLRTRKLTLSATTIQSTSRRMAGTIFVRNAIASILVIQQSVRMTAERDLLKEMRLERATIAFQSTLRSRSIARTTKLCMRWIVGLQLISRSSSQRRAFIVGRREQAARTIQRVFKIQSRIKSCRSGILLLHLVQSSVRRLMARTELAVLRTEANSVGRMRTRISSLERLLESSTEQSTAERERLAAESDELKRKLTTFSDLVERLQSEKARLAVEIDTLKKEREAQLERSEQERLGYQRQLQQPGLRSRPHSPGESPIVVKVDNVPDGYGPLGAPPPDEDTKHQLARLLQSEALFAELQSSVKQAAMPTEEGDPMLYFPAGLIEHWVRLSFSLTGSVDQTRFSLILGDIRASLKTEADDVRCAFWIANLMHLRLSEETRLRDAVRALAKDLIGGWRRELCAWFAQCAATAVMDYQALPGYLSAPPVRSTLLYVFTAHKQAVSEDPRTGRIVGNPEQSTEVLTSALDHLLMAMRLARFPPDTTRLLLASIFTAMGATCFNQLMLRKSYATWKRGVQIQFNVSRLEEWCVCASMADLMRCFDATMQAAKLLQLAKTSIADLATIAEACPALSIVQIRKLLTMYVPDEFEIGPVSEGLLAQLDEWRAKLVAAAKSAASSANADAGENESKATPVHLLHDSEQQIKASSVLLLDETAPALKDLDGLGWDASAIVGSDDAVLSVAETMASLPANLWKLFALAERRYSYR